MPKPRAITTRSAPTISASERITKASWLASAIGIDRGDVAGAAVEAGVVRIEDRAEAPASGVDGRKPSQSRRAAIRIQPGTILSMMFWRDAMSADPGHMCRGRPTAVTRIGGPG